MIYEDLSAPAYTLYAYGSVMADHPCGAWFLEFKKSSHWIPADGLFYNYDAVFAHPTGSGLAMMMPSHSSMRLLHKLPYL